MCKIFVVFITTSSSSFINSKKKKKKTKSVKKKSHYYIFLVLKKKTTTTTITGTNNNNECCCVCHSLFYCFLLQHEILQVEFISLLAFVSLSYDVTPKIVCFCMSVFVCVFTIFIV